MDEFNASIVDDVAHRPWPMPGRPWVMTQTWHDLLFAHWRIDPAELRSMVPPVFELDLFDGEAWIGVVPFTMSNVAPRGVPSLPQVSAFPELNVRTYVRVGTKAGVYFFSLDAGSAVAVQAARRLFNLPYHTASMTVVASGDGVEYQSRRKRGRVAEFAATYGPLGAPFVPREGTLEYFLTERYCLFHLDRRGRPYRMDIHHPPWHLQSGRADIVENSMASANGLTLPGDSPLLHFSKRQDMVAWLPSSVSE